MCEYLAFLADFRRLLDVGQLGQAVALAEAMVLQCPESLRYREHLAQALWHEDRFADAQRVLEVAQALGVLSTYAQLMHVHCSSCLGRRRLALRQMRQLLSCGSFSQEVLEIIARSFGEQREYRLALEVCFHLAESRPNHASAWYGIGFYQEKLGVPAEATNDAFRKALLLSDCLCTRLRYAKNLSELGRTEEAYNLVRNIDFHSCCKSWQREVVYLIAWSVGDREMLCLMESLEKTVSVHEVNPKENEEN